MPEAVQSAIQIRNPRIKQLVAEEQAHGAGRNASEAAENLISEAVEARRLKRESGRDKPLPSAPAA